MAGKGWLGSCAPRGNGGRRVAGVPCTSGQGWLTGTVLRKECRNEGKGVNPYLQRVWLAAQRCPGPGMVARSVCPTSRLWHGLVGSGRERGKK